MAPVRKLKTYGKKDCNNLRKNIINTDLSNIQDAINVEKDDTFDKLWNGTIFNKINLKDSFKKIDSSESDFSRSKIYLSESAEQQCQNMRSRTESVKPGLSKKLKAKKSKKKPLPQIILPAFNQETPDKDRIDQSLVIEYVKNTETNASLNLSKFLSSKNTKTLKKPNGSSFHIVSKNILKSKKYKPDCSLVNNSISFDIASPKNNILGQGDLISVTSVSELNKTGVHNEPVECVIDSKKLQVNDSILDYSVITRSKKRKFLESYSDSSNSGSKSNDTSQNYNEPYICQSNILTNKQDMLVLEKRHDNFVIENKSDIQNKSNEQMINDSGRFNNIVITRSRKRKFLESCTSNASQEIMSKSKINPQESTSRLEHTDLLDESLNISIEKNNINKLLPFSSTPIIKKNVNTMKMPKHSFNISIKLVDENKKPICNDNSKENVTVDQLAVSLPKKQNKALLDVTNDLSISRLNVISPMALKQKKISKFSIPVKQALYNLSKHSNSINEQLKSFLLKTADFNSSEANIDSFESYSRMIISTEMIFKPLTIHLQRLNNPVNQENHESQISYVTRRSSKRFNCDIKNAKITDFQVILNKIPIDKCENIKIKPVENPKESICVVKQPIINLTCNNYDDLFHSYPNNSGVSKSDGLSESSLFINNDSIKLHDDAEKCVIKQPIIHLTLNNFDMLETNPNHDDPSDITSGNSNSLNSSNEECVIKELKTNITLDNYDSLVKINQSLDNPSNITSALSVSNSLIGNSNEDSSVYDSTDDCVIKELITDLTSNNYDSVLPRNNESAEANNITDSRPQVILLDDSITDSSQINLTENSTRRPTTRSVSKKITSTVDSNISNHEVNLTERPKPTQTNKTQNILNKSSSISKPENESFDKFNSVLFDDNKFIVPPYKRMLKPGKLWRRSLLHSRSTMNYEMTCSAMAGSTCSCGKCHISSFSQSIPIKRCSIRVVPISSNRSTRRTSILEDYAKTSYVPEQDIVDSHLENSVRCLSISSNRKTRFKKSVSVVTAREVVLRRCGQTEPLPFDECYPGSILKNCQKIGEGVYGEVFLYKNQNGHTSVIKVIPIEGDQIINGERQKKFEEILSEIIIAMELSDLRNNKKNSTSGFGEVQKIKCVQGCYPERLLDLWNLYEETKGTENDSPEIFNEDQLYIVLELANGGNDLEAYYFNNAQQTYAMFQQVACSLAIAEEELHFEHRDLHWGNVLLTTVDKRDKKTFCLDGKVIEVPSQGVAVAIIDFTLSRIEYDGVVIFNDLSIDPDLFTGDGDYQFEIYKEMQKKNGNQWHHFEPYTNLLWLHYILDKAVTALRYKNTKSKLHKEYLRKLRSIKDYILNYNSVKNFVLDYFN